ncbi:bifunctional anthranilate synthase component I family protein/class IV aminotransferase [Kocuria rhizophila]|uniref:bifunctional anthranilate synthase component I family protein/class IV aminotransferase n=1 Tax=Kocuria TaxID=57493 RepID=UPI001EF624DC|nr:bifunctional anthranilate synthase component I family protein/class IV aminotransferase [Kocuria rhizophila]MCG7424165.1 bifunctional anthranilate synthase component I family protein/aminotransferase class IV [Kocuria rhizophila]MCT1879347.1 bifunctional anthranilate synthase component I family protein/class IV aminotransferase [Kocuria rhizophila]WIW67545.1 bifunctional anthranilate synthase component I family protein/class IV aminotransferase [Kocuria sp. ChxB]
MPRTALPHRVSPVQMLRALRDEPGLAALFGDWLHGDAVIGIRPTRVLGADEDPFAALGAADDDAALTAEDPARFGGGWLGYLGYQLSRRLESLPPAPPHSGGLPEHHLAHYDHVLVHDAAADRWLCESLPGADPGRVAETIGTVERALAAGPAASSSGVCAPHPYRCEPFEAAVTGAAHAEAVRRALAHIRDGDIFQANICRELTAAFDGDPLDLFCAGYERLRPRFAAFLRVPGGAVASFSPELYLRRTGRAVLTSPIKGTAPADSDPRELHASAKNRAENVMIVDLMRNDLSRACVPGSVLSPAVPRVEPHTGVHHLVADVHGTLRPGLDDAALLRSTFPPGSCTGAPKIRATEIINELETTARGVYTGGIGCVSPLAGLVVNVAIRTFEFSGGAVRLGVGGGIVADSDPDGEAFETLVKAAPLLDAVGARFGAELSREWREHAESSEVATPGCVVGGGASSRAAASLSDAPVIHSTPDPTLGIFTTMLVREGRPEQLAEHLARLGNSVRACFSRELPGALAEQIIQRAAALDGPHRLRVTAVPDAGSLRVEMTHAPLNPPGAAPPVEPWVLRPVVVPGGWGSHKWADRHALDAAPGPWSPVCDPLLVDEDSTVLETGRANVFVVRGGVVTTPPADGRILPGVMRARVIAALRSAGYEVRERDTALADLAEVSEVFVTNALRGARPVGEVRGVGRWAHGPVTAWVQHALAAAG